MKKLFLGLTLASGLLFSEEYLGMSLAQAKSLCDKKDGHGCFIAGMKYWNGDTVKINDRKSNEYLKKGCEYKSIKACESIGYAYKRGGRAVKRDLVMAKAYYEKACEITKEQGKEKEKYNACKRLKSFF